MLLATSNEQIRTQGLRGALERCLRPAVGFDHPRDVLKDPHLFSRDYYRRLFVQSWNSIVWPFAIGGTVLSVVCSLLAYPLTLRALRAYRAVKDHRKRIDL